MDRPRSFSKKSEACSLAIRPLPCRELSRHAGNTRAGAGDFTIDDGDGLLDASTKKRSISVYTHVSLLFFAGKEAVRSMCWLRMRL